MYAKSNMETFIVICKVDSQWEFAVRLRKQTGALYQPKRVGWGGKWEGDGKEDQKGEDICISMADSCSDLTENNKIL